jgi:hypothetical protein
LDYVTSQSSIFVQRVLLLTVPFKLLKTGWKCSDFLDPLIEFVAVEFIEVSVLPDESNLPSREASSSPSRV